MKSVFSPSIDLLAHPAGMYLIFIKDKQQGTLRKFKITKEQQLLLNLYQNGFVLVHYPKSKKIHLVNISGIVKLTQGQFKGIKFL